LASWGKEMPKSFNVVFYFDPKSPRHSNPDKTSYSQLNNFISAAKMLEASGLAKVTLEKGQYPDGIARQWRSYYTKCMSDTDCVGIVICGSSWTRSKYRVDCNASHVLRDLQEKAIQNGGKSTWHSARVAVVQNMDAKERVLWRFESRENRPYWTDIFNSEARRVKVHLVGFLDLSNHC
jgi:hypothetical protein